MCTKRTNKSEPLHAFNFSIFMQIIHNNFLALNQNKVLNKQQKRRRLCVGMGWLSFVRTPFSQSMLISLWKESHVPSKAKQIRSTCCRVFPSQNFGCQLLMKAEKKGQWETAMIGGDVRATWSMRKRISFALRFMNTEHDIRFGGAFWVELLFGILKFLRRPGLCHQSTSASSSAVYLNFVQVSNSFSFIARGRGMPKVICSSTNPFETHRFP